MGKCNIGNSQSRNLADDRIPGNNVWSNGICIVSIRETKDLVVIYTNYIYEEDRG